MNGMVSWLILAINVLNGPHRDLVASADPPQSSTLFPSEYDQSQEQPLYG